MYDYQKDRKFFAQTAEEIKDLAARELDGLGAGGIETAHRGVYFNADNEALYRANYCSRLVSRILAPLISFECVSTDQLYEKASAVNWTDLISRENTFAIFSNVSNSAITNSHFASLRLKDAIVDTFREKTGERPGIDPEAPDLWLNLHIRKDKAVISLDTSGGPLHKRGYRKDSVEAPMQETVAAAIIAFSEWDGSVPLYDPMCGSGTLLCEALMHYCRIPSGIFRRSFGFEFLPDYDNSLWTKAKKEIDRQVRELPEGHISGSDISSKAVNISKTNLKDLPQGGKLKLDMLDLRKSGGLTDGVIVTNPPYGIRMRKMRELDKLYKSLGDFLKQKCKGSSAYIYFGEREFIKKIGLKPAWKKPLKTGGLDGRLVKYELF